ncbi:hypothetical protein HDU76_009732, partial [Blyttiomyces sp. JEL0837]
MGISIGGMVGMAMDVENGGLESPQETGNNETASSIPKSVKSKSRATSVNRRSTRSSHGAGGTREGRGSGKSTGGRGKGGKNIEMVISTSDVNGLVEEDGDGFGSSSSTVGVLRGRGRDTSRTGGEFIPPSDV